MIALHHFNGLTTKQNKLILLYLTFVRIRMKRMYEILISIFILLDENG